MKYPIGIQNFECLISEGYLYIDKTSQIDDKRSSMDSIKLSPIPLFFQSGYLTIKGYDKEFCTYLLGFPNKEVEEGLTKFLVPY